MDLLINTFGTRIRSSGQRIILYFPNRTKKEYPILKLEKIIILRPSSISTTAVQLALEAGVDIVYLNHFGKAVGRIFPSNPKGLTGLRRAQVTVCISDKSLLLAKAFVAGKSKNQIIYLSSSARKYNLHTHAVQGRLCNQEMLKETVQIGVSGLGNIFSNIRNKITKDK